MSQDVWVLAEHWGGELEEVTKELLGEGRGLANWLGGRLCGILLGYGVERLVSPLAHYGAEIVYLAEDELLSIYNSDAYTMVLTELIRQHAPSIFLCGATPNGLDLAPGLAMRLGAPLATNCILLKADGEGRLSAVRPVHQDRVYETVVYPPTKPWISTLRPGVRGAEQPNVSQRAEVVKVKVELRPKVIRTRHLGFIPPDPQTVDISEAQKVVAGGHGVGGAEGFDRLWQLANLLGASVGGTRVAVDRGWLKFERQIGASGKTVEPKLYIACGISGASQHIVGMKDSELVIAINTDPMAPLFSVADLAVVGDLHEVIPAVIDRLNYLRARA